MRSNRKRHEKNYIVVKCESKAYEKFQFAIRNGVCEPESYDFFVKAKIMAKQFQSQIVKMHLSL